MGKELKISYNMLNSIKDSDFSDYTNNMSSAYTSFDGLRGNVSSDSYLSYGWLKIIGLMDKVVKKRDSIDNWYTNYLDNIKRIEEALPDNQVEIDEIETKKLLQDHADINMGFLDIETYINNNSEEDINSNNISKRKEETTKAANTGFTNVNASTSTSSNSSTATPRPTTRSNQSTSSVATPTTKSNTNTTTTPSTVKRSTTNTWSGKNWAQGLKSQTEYYDMRTGKTVAVVQDDSGGRAWYTVDDKKVVSVDDSVIARREIGTGKPVHVNYIYNKKDEVVGAEVSYVDNAQSITNDGKKVDEEAPTKPDIGDYVDAGTSIAGSAATAAAESIANDVKLGWDIASTMFDNIF